jgi:putative Holliday junction resolvase
LTRLLGVDLGERRVGLAVADLESHVVRSLATLRRGGPSEDLERIARIVAEQRIDTVVVGWPRNADGSEGEQALRTRAWADAIGAALPVSVRLRDEYGSSQGAEMRLGRPSRGRSGAPPSPAARARRRAQVDRTSAVLILEAEIRDRDTLLTPPPALPRTDRS